MTGKTSEPNEETSGNQSGTVKGVGKGERDIEPLGEKTEQEDTRFENTLKGDDYVNV